MAFKALHLTVAVAGIALASAVAYWWQHQPAAPRPGGGAAAASRAPQAVVVEAGQVTTMRLLDEAQAVGSLRSRQTVVLKPEVSGRITQLNFRDGSPVRKGQVLVQFDNQLELAQLRQSEAQLAIARTNHQRNQELAARNFISASAVDQSAAALQVAQAQHALVQATVARLRILAPFDGIAGIGNVSVGDYLSAGQDIVNLEDMAVMYVDYRLPERYLARVRTGQTAHLALDALPGQAFEARVLAVDPRIDAEGRSIGVRACVDNRRLLLRPGMFARISAVFEVRDNVPVVPEQAVVLAEGTPYVYRIIRSGPPGTPAVAQRVAVKLGLRRDGKVELTAGGLQPGEWIVLAGQQRLGAGSTPVTIGGAAADGPLEGSAASAAPAPAPGAGAAQPVLVSSPPAAPAPAAVAGAGCAVPGAGAPAPGGRIVAPPRGGAALATGVL